MNGTGDDARDSEQAVLHRQNQSKNSEEEEEWEACSLYSNDDENESVDDTEERLPLPGRESHTSDMEQFEAYVKVIKEKKRERIDTPFSAKFWDCVGTVLEKARPVGFSEADDPKSVVPRGPEDNEAFLKKVLETNLVNPIHPVQLAKEFGMSLMEVLTELLCATRAGMMSMKLTPNCLRCGSSACSLDLDKLKRIDREKRQSISVYCEGCRYHNHVDCLQKIKVVFVLNNDVFYVLAENFACSPSKASMAASQVFAMVPATFSGSGSRYSMGCGGTKMLRPALPAARYRMRCPVSKTDNYLVIERDATDEDEPVELTVHVSDIRCKSIKSEVNKKILTCPHGKIHMDIFTDTKSFFVCWIQDDIDDHTLFFLPEEERKPYTNAQELLNHPTYQYWFGDATAANLSKVVKQMHMAKPEGLSKRRRTIRSQEA